MSKLCSVFFCAVSEWLILTPEQFRFFIQALFTLKVIYGGRCIPELMQFVNKGFSGKIWVQFCFKNGRRGLRNLRR